MEAQRTRNGGDGSGNGDEHPPTAAITNSRLLSKLSLTSSSINYPKWRDEMLDFLGEKSLRGFVDGTSACPPQTVNDPTIGEIMNPYYTQWKRKDRIVREWIFHFIQGDLVPTTAAGKHTARDVWENLEEMFKNYQPRPERAPHDPASAARFNKLRNLLKLAKQREWGMAKEILDKFPGLGNPEDDQHVTDMHYKILLLSITGTGELNNVDFVAEFVNQVPDKSLEVVDAENGNLLHAAAFTGNKAAAALLEKKMPELLLVVHDFYLLPVHAAAEFHHREVLEYLISVTPWLQDQTPFANDRGLLELFCHIIDAEFFDIALDLVRCYRQIAVTKRKDNMTALSCMATAVTAFSHFRGRPLLELWESFLHTFVCRGPETESFTTCCKNAKHKQALELVKYLCTAIKYSDGEEADYKGTIYEDAILKAAGVGNHYVVNVILQIFPSAIMCIDPSTGYSIFHLAVINRCEHVFNLIYDLGKKKNMFLVSPDSEGNNVLHLAAKLAPRHKLNDQASGAVLQLLHEIQWYKKVEEVVSSSYKCQKNNKGQIPAAMFTEEHKGLMDTAEKLMKDTSTSCSVVAALIITIMFQAVIAVPGGNESKTGFPILSGDNAFLVFAISDAISLFASVTSLLLFLSILITSFSQDPFLWKHPTILIFALLALYISKGSMMVAFTASSFLVLGRKETRVLVPMCAVASLAGTSFMLLQFRPFWDLILLTSGLGLKRRSHSMARIIVTRSFSYVWKVVAQLRQTIGHVGKVVAQVGEAGYRGFLPQAEALDSNPASI